VRDPANSSSLHEGGASSEGKRFGKGEAFPQAKRQGCGDSYRLSSDVISNLLKTSKK